MPSEAQELGPRDPTGIFKQLTSLMRLCLDGTSPHLKACVGIINITNTINHTEHSKYVVSVLIQIKAHKADIIIHILHMT